MTIVNPTSSSYNSKSKSIPFATATRAEAKKLNEYKVQVEEEGDVFFPMVWETTGASTITVKRLLQMFVETSDISMRSDAPSMKFMLDFIHQGIQLANAQINVRGMKLMQRHGKMNRVPPRNE